MSPTADPTWGFRIQLLEWLRVTRLVRHDPVNVALGARIFFTLGGHDEEPTYRRFLRSPVGAQLVRDATAYPPLFTDYERLRALPPGTLGREYVRQLDDREIHPIALAELTQAAYQGRRFTPEHAYVRDRVRDCHDLLHTLTGYGIDIFGETGVLAFTFGQTGNKGWAMLVFLQALLALVKGRFDGWVVAWKGFRRGRQARCIPAVDDWNRLLQLPLDEARAELDISPLAPYRPLAMEDAFSGFAKVAS